MLAVEFVAPLLVLAPFLWPWLRLAGLAALVSLHVAFGLMLHIWLFPLIDLTALSLLIPGMAWAWLTTRGSWRDLRRATAVDAAGFPSARAPAVSLGGDERVPPSTSNAPGSAGASASTVSADGATVAARAVEPGASAPPAAAAAARPRTPLESIVIHYDEDCGFCLKTCLILRELLLPPRVRIVPAQRDPAIHEILERENSWVVTDEHGTPHVHWRAMILLFRRSLLFRPIGWLMSAPPLPALGHRLYRLVADHRDALGRLSERFLPWREVRVRPTLAGAVLAGFFLYVVTAFNVYGLPGVKAPRPALVDRAARLVRIDQHWDMFAPYPLTVSIYPLVPGVLRSGETVDLYELTSSATDWKEPERMYPLYPSYRWRKYMGRVDSHRNNAVRRAFGDWLCRTWNRPPRPLETELATLEVHFVKLRTNTEGEPKQSSRRMAWRHWCFGEFAPDAKERPAPAAAAKAAVSTLRAITPRPDETATTSAERASRTGDRTAPATGN